MPWGPSVGGTATSRMETAIGVLLRTPGLFIIDYWWRQENKPYIIGAKTDPWTAFITNGALINGLLLLILPLSCLRSLYTHVMCGALLVAAHLLSHYFVNVPEMIGAEEVCE